MYGVWCVYVFVPICVCVCVCVRVCIRAGDTHCIVMSACISVWPFGVALNPSNVNPYSKNVLSVTIN